MGVMFRAAAALVLAPACADRELEPEVPDYRVDACERWCPIAIDPVCGSEYAVVETVEECVETCIMDDECHWRPDGKGNDRCGAPHVAYIDCVADLSCEDQADHFRGAHGIVDPGIACYAALEEVLSCSQRAIEDEE